MFGPVTLAMLTVTLPTCSDCVALVFWMVPVMAPAATPGASPAFVDVWVINSELSAEVVEAEPVPEPVEVQYANAPVAMPATAMSPTPAAMSFRFLEPNSFMMLPGLSVKFDLASVSPLAPRRPGDQTQPADHHVRPHCPCVALAFRTCRYRPPPVVSSVPADEAPCPPLFRSAKPI